MRIAVSLPSLSAAAIERLASDVDLGAALGEAAKQRVTAYDLPSALGGWEQLIGWENADARFDDARVDE